MTSANVVEAVAELGSKCYREREELRVVLAKLCELNAKGLPIAKTWGVAEELLLRLTPNVRGEA